MISDRFPGKPIDFYAHKHCTVTGATGLIGSYVVKLLKESGATVRAIGGTSRGANEFTRLADEIYYSDLAVPDCAYDSVKDTEIVFSCAGITGGIGLPQLDAVSYVGPATAITINTLHACVEAKVKKFGFLSSTTVYAPSERPVKEDDVDLPDALYPVYKGIGQSKRFLEQLCAYYTEHTDLYTSVVRPSGAYGRFDNFDEKISHVLPGLVNRALNLKDGEDFEIWGDGEDVRDLIHAQDVARGLLLAVSETNNGLPFNIASGSGIRTYDLAKTILMLAGKSNSKVVTNPAKPSALKTRLVNIKRARTYLAFEPEISLTAGIQDVIDWRRSL